MANSTMATKEYLLAVVSAVLSGKEIPALPQDVDVTQFVRLAFTNAVQGIVFSAFAENPGALPEALFARLKKSFQAGVLRDAAQTQMLSILREQLNDADIDFLLLKGAHLKALYPAPELRFMVDMDILVREHDQPRAKDILLANGFTLDFDNGKDIVFFKKPFLTVELHRTLFPEEYRMYPYFLSVWERAEFVGNHEYKMTDNDLYVYTLAHLTEHYETAGSCFRPVMDLYLMEKKLQGKLDFDYIRAQFEALGIAEFAENIRKLGRCMFENAPKDDTLNLMENYVTLGPPVQNATVAADEKLGKQSKARRLFSAAFPKFKHMKTKYPILKKLPFLLPFFWIWRLLGYAFTKDKALMRKKEALLNADKKSADVMQKIFKKSGL